MMKSVRLLSSAFMATEESTQTAMLEAFSQLPEDTAAADNHLIDSMLGLNRDGSEYVLIFVRTAPTRKLSTLVLEALAIKLLNSHPENKICAGLEVDQADVSRVVHMAAMCNLKVVLIGGGPETLIGMTEGIGAYTGAPLASLFLQADNVELPQPELLQAAVMQYEEGEVGRLSAMAGTVVKPLFAALERACFSDLNTLYSADDVSWSKAVITHADYLADSKLPSMMTIDLARIAVEENGTRQLPISMAHAKVFLSRSCNRLKSRYLHLAPPAKLSDRQCASMIAELILRFYQSHEARSSINLNYQTL
ncbi:hypothetical protein [Corallincola spongiicola]|nr:hypothetical protein [Corallincola spongiicola]